MKKIEAVVRSEKFYPVRDALDKAGVKGLMTYEIKGRGGQKGLMSVGERRVGPGAVIAGASQVEGALIPKTKIELVCDDGDVEKIIDTIIMSAKTGEIGDGKIFVQDIVDVVRVRTGERGIMAI